MKWIKKQFNYDTNIYPANTKLNNMEIAAQTIINYMKQNKKITVFGDYDVDGVSAASIMYKALYPIYNTIQIYLPNRLEGYGVSKKFIENTDSDLIITVDNGITAVEQVELAKSLGKEIIVTDHHNPQDVLPKCLIVNPKLDANDYLRDICGAGVAWYLCLEIYKQLGINPQAIYDMVDILALATIADMVPMKQGNKEIVKYGLNLMEKNQFSSNGLRHIVQGNIEVKYGIETDDIGFSVAPVFNAIGRLADPNLAFMLLAQDRLEHLAYAKSLNDERKNIQNEKVSIALEKVNDNNNFIIYVDNSLEKGMIGLVAGDICNKFHKPTIVISNGHGSGRSVYDISIFNIVKQAEEYLEKWGGHAQALGLSIPIENIKAFENKIYEITKDLVIEPIIYYHDEIESSQIFSTRDYLNSIKPFGQENPEPKWLIKNVIINEQKIIGKNKNVLMAKINGITAFKFKTKELIGKNNCDILATIKRNKIMIEDWK